MAAHWSKGRRFGVEATLSGQVPLVMGLSGPLLSDEVSRCSELC